MCDPAGLLARATVERIVNVRWNAGETLSISAFVIKLITPASRAACIPFIEALFRTPPPTLLRLRLHSHRRPQTPRVLQMPPRYVPNMLAGDAFGSSPSRILSLQSPSSAGAVCRHFPGTRAILGASNQTLLPRKRVVTYVVGVAYERRDFPVHARRQATCPVRRSGYIKREASGETPALPSPLFHHDRITTTQSSPNPPTASHSAFLTHRRCCIAGFVVVSCCLHAAVCYLHRVRTQFRKCCARVQSLLAPYMLLSLCCACLL